MRILVLSDSHGRTGALRRALFQQPAATHVFFLGDVTGDLEEIRLENPERIFHAVCGNCDWFSTEKSVDTACVGGVNIFFTHGHRHGVKSGTGTLVTAALEQNCRIALYGHTHIPHISYENGVYVVNPGSVAESRNGPNSYGVIDLTPQGILPAILTL